MSPNLDGKRPSKANGDPAPNPVPRILPSFGFTTEIQTEIIGCGLGFCVGQWRTLARDSTESRLISSASRRRDSEVKLVGAVRGPQT
jgi:hypothetical protein